MASMMQDYSSSALSSLAPSSAMADKSHSLWTYGDKNNEWHSTSLTIAPAIKSSLLAELLKNVVTQHHYTSYKQEVCLFLKLCNTHNSPSDNGDALKVCILKWQLVSNLLGILINGQTKQSDHWIISRSFYVEKKCIYWFLEASVHHVWTGSNKSWKNHKGQARLPSNASRCG